MNDTSAQHRPARHLRTRRGLTAMALALTACADAETPAPDEAPALDVTLIVDPNQSSEAGLAAQLERLVLIVDAPEPLYRPGEESSEGGIQVKNADADPADLELVATLAVDGQGLPTFRLERGGLPDVAVDLRVLGFAPGRDVAIAEGVLRSARFGDRPTPVELPFDLRASELPPRVVDVLPSDGTDLGTGCSLPSLMVVFSRPVDATSLRVPGAVVLEPFGAPIDASVDASGLVATFTLAGAQGTGELAFRLQVGAGVHADEGGPALDQVASEEGLQPFVSDVRLRCDEPGPQIPCGGPENPCEPRCGEVECPPDPRVACVDGSCVPTSCAGCAEGLVCDPRTVVCVGDCRTASAIEGCDPDVPCDLATGLCG